MRLILLALVIAALPVAAQPVAVHVLDVTDAVGIPLEEGAWEAPPALYWAGVTLDVAALGSGAYLVVVGAQLAGAADDDEAGAGAFVGALFGPFFLILGSAMVGVSTYDLIRVLRGDNPALARAFDPDRRLPPPGPPRYPIPRPPPGPRY